MSARHSPKRMPSRSKCRRCSSAAERTKGLLPKVLHALAAHVPNSKTVMIPNATHPMFEQAPQKFSEIVLDFLAS